MTARFPRLGNHDIRAVLFQPDGFFDRRRAAPHFRTRRFDALQVFGRGQAEVEADHRRAVTFHTCQRIGIKRLPPAAAGNVVFRQPVSLEIRTQHGKPCLVLRAVGRRRAVGEKVEVVRTAAAFLLHPCQRFFQTRGVIHRPCQRTQSAGFADSQRQLCVMRKRHRRLNQRIAQ